MNGEALLERVRELTGDHRWASFEEINDAYETLLKRANLWISRVRDETSLVFKDGVKTYSLPMHRIRRLEGIAVKASDGEQEWRTLEEVTDDAFDKQVLASRKADGTDDEDTPLSYRLQGGFTGQLEVTPTPDGTYAGRILYTGEPVPLDRLITPILPGSYHSTIAKLAAAKVLGLTPTDHPEYQNRLVKADRLEREAARDYFPLANDVSNNRRGVQFSRQPIMRA